MVRARRASRSAPPRIATAAGLRVVFLSGGPAKSNAVQAARTASRRAIKARCEDVYRAHQAAELSPIQTPLCAGSNHRRWHATRDQDRRVVNANARLARAAPARLSRAR